MIAVIFNLVVDFRIASRARAQRISGVLALNDFQHCKMAFVTFFRSSCFDVVNIINQRIIQTPDFPHNFRANMGSIRSSANPCHGGCKTPLVSCSYSEILLFLIVGLKLVFIYCWHV